MKKKEVSSIIVVTAIMVVFAVATCLVYSFSENSQKTDNYLTITLDKKIYNPSDEIKITLHNLSDENIWFTNTSFGLEFERWDGVEWVFYGGTGGGQIISSIDPHGAVMVVQRLTVNLEGFHPGKCRVSTRSGYLDEEGGEYVQAYAEFEVVERPGPIWPLIAGVIGVILVIGIAETVYMKRR